MKIVGIKKKYIEASELPEGEKVYLKKDGLTKEWRVVHPYTNEDGSLNWFRVIFGSWETLIQITMIVLISVVFFFVYKSDMSQFKDIVAAPCKYCQDCFSVNNNVSGFFNLTR